MSLTKAEWFENLASRNKTPNPIFHLPGVTNWTILPDWMHVANEGCGVSHKESVLPQAFASSKQSLYIWPRKLQAQHCISSPSSIWEAFQLGIVHCKANSNTIHLGWIDSSCLGWEHHLGVSVWYLLCLTKFCFKILNTEKMAAVIPKKRGKKADLSSPEKKGKKIGF